MNFTRAKYTTATNMAARASLYCGLLLSVCGLSFGGCPSYVDSTGEYVPPFDCPQYIWENADETYCCRSDSGTYNFCCDESLYKWYTNSHWSIGYTFAIMTGVLLMLSAFCFIVRLLVIRSRRSRQEPVMYVASQRSDNPTANIARPPPPYPLSTEHATMSPSLSPSVDGTAASPPIYGGPSVDPPPPYPGYNSNPFGATNEKPYDVTY
ncbi:cysteine and tyrosine-rich protein 1-like isoform X1 [Acanthaster planci]|uniref:Cysteine and tyrosine-rich protein 1-like isoform X1 n=1 Tax=Acanthaster planci TaxID=133434 RepID=A0A8B7YDZ7_ACAPL|nr:cysteine and tyrosine-rich protein 1-like isoform X1 [Acanthaster planci]